VVKEGKVFKPTKLGIVTTAFMVDNFDDIVNIEFTAQMEEKLDQIEEGKQNWVKIIEQFYKELQDDIKTAEEQLSGVRIKIPDEETDEKCEFCGRNMVIKSGKFGKFLACPGYPECKNTKPITYKTEAKCPKCGGTILQKFSKNGNKYYGCENAPKCDFMTWYEPVAQTCDLCGSSLLKKSGFKGKFTLICSNETCPNHNGVAKSENK